VTSIALVEDNADNRLLVRVLIRDRYELREYADGEEALAAFAVSPPDLVLLDISLPGLSGIDVLARMRADGHLAHIPVIAMTAHADGDERAVYTAAGFDDYVAKPIIDDRILLDAIEGGLARAQH
jgi:CheY-like chemotaxis protein